jgi:uncharacterized protein YndB with AHSA1/START domain
VLKWWGQPGVYRCTKFQADLRVGGKWRSDGIGRDDHPFTISGEFLEVDSPRVLAYTWTATWTGELQTIVRWELVQKNQGTLVTLRHSGFAAHPDVRQNYRGWPAMMGWLRALVEKGETVDDRKAMPAS